jgi:hypothetical protein
MLDKQHMKEMGWNPVEKGLWQHKLFWNYMPVTFDEACAVHKVVSTAYARKIGLINIGEER